MSEPTITAYIEGLNPSELDAVQTALIRGGHMRNGISIHITIDGSEPSFDDVVQGETVDLIDGLDRLIRRIPADDTTLSQQHDTVPGMCTAQDIIDAALRRTGQRIVLLTHRDDSFFVDGLFHTIAVGVHGHVMRVVHTDHDHHIVLDNGTEIRVCDPQSARGLRADIVVLTDSDDAYDDDMRMTVDALTTRATSSIITTLRLTETSAS